MFISIQITKVLGFQLSFPPKTDTGIEESSFYIQGSYGFRSFQSVFGRWTGSYRSPWIPNTNLGNIAGYGIWFGNQGLPDNAYRPFLPNRFFFL